MLNVYQLLWPLHLGLLLVCCLYKEVYLQIFKCVSFWLQDCCGNWEGWTRKSVNHTSWMAVVTPTDRPKSVHNRCVIELFLWRCLSLCTFDISAGVGAFVILLSQISSFFSSWYFTKWFSCYLQILNTQKISITKLERILYKQKNACLCKKRLKWIYFQINK